MDALDSLLQQIKPVALAHGMDAYIVGSVKWVSPSDQDDGYFDDGRLLKIAPIGVLGMPLLEIEHENGTRLYKHKSEAVTKKYKGRHITSKWVLGFILANAELARQMGTSNHFPEQNQTTPLSISQSPQERDTLRKERHEKICSCLGTSENCPRCYGSGKYLLDGLGNRV